MSKQVVAQEIAQSIGSTLYHLQIELLPSRPHELMDWVRLWNRERRLSSIGLYLDLTEFDINNPAQAMPQKLQYILHHSEGICWLDTRMPLSNLSQENIILEIDKPTKIEQMTTGQALLSTHDKNAASTLATQFDFNTSTIYTIAKSVVG